MKKFTIILIFCLSSFSSSAAELEEYLNKAFTSRHFNALIYQFRFSDSYQYLMSENYDLETMEDYAKQGDAFANVLLFHYYSETNQYKKAEQASLKVFVQTIPGHRYMAFENAMILFSKAEKHTAKEAAYLIYLRDELDSIIDEQRLDFLVERHGLEKVNKKLEKLERKIERLSNKLPEKSIRLAVKPLHIQKRLEG